MMNFIIQQGHLVDKPVYRPGQNGGKSSIWGKIGVYQGKDQQGNDLDTLFMEFTAFGSDADTLNAVANKGDLIVASGRYSVVKSTSNDGREFTNHKIVGNAKMCYKNPNNNNQNYQQAPVQQPQQNYQQAPMQQNYQQVPVQQPQQNYQQNPWA